jgi:protein involved in sex pheromone biosynthesis
MKCIAQLIIASSIIFILSGCSTWNDDFEGEVVRARPHDSIHKISNLVDKGIIKETEDDFVLSESMIAHTKVFQDGSVSRGVEDVRRMYLMTYEDAGKNLHAAHHTYFVLRPATWVSK